MPASLILLLASIAGIPILLIAEAATWQALLSIIAAGALGAVAYNLQMEEIEHVQTVLTRTVITALVPVVWILMQMLPVGLVGAGHPIWSSTETALGSAAVATFSVNLGASLVVAGLYAVLVGLGTATAIIAVDRVRAEWILLALLAVSALLAVLVLSGIGFGAVPASEVKRAGATLVLAIGCVIAGAATMRAYERSELRRSRPGGMTILRLAPGTVVAIVTFCLCLIGLIRFGHPHVIIAMWSGVAIFAGLLVTRRLGFGLWAIGAIAVVIVAVAGQVFGQLGLLRTTSPLALFAGRTSDPLVALSDRILGDARWAGSGAATFADVAQLYRQVDEPGRGELSAPSTAVAVATELGKPMLFLICVAVAVLVVFLARATIRRGRDSFYPAAGVATLCIAGISAFGDAALLQPAPAFLVAVILGLAVGQSLGKRGALPPT